MTKIVIFHAGTEYCRIELPTFKILLFIYISLLKQRKLFSESTYCFFFLIINCKIYLNYFVQHKDMYISYQMKDI